jgi:flagellar hook-associated protein 3 FlgL
MSLSLNSIYDNIIFALNNHASKMSSFQEQISTGSKVNRSSDDPSAAYRLLSLDTDLSKLKNYTDNLSSSMDTMEYMSTIFQNITSTFTEVKARLTQVTSSVYNDEARKRVADGMNDLLEQVVSFANSKHANEYLFGGNKTESAPYAVERENGKIASVTYQGSLDDRHYEIAPGVDEKVYLSGDNIFKVDGRAEPQFFGNSGAAAGTGTSNVEGIVWLTVTNDGSNYQISIDDGATTTTVPAGGQANQVVTDSRTGKVLYVDTTGINATGTDMVHVTGTTDIFNTLIELRDTLYNDRGLPASQIENIRTHFLTIIEEVNNKVVQESVTAGSKINFMDSLKSNLDNLVANTEDESSRLEEADIAQLAIDLSRHQVLYQMSLSIASKIMSTSLLDFL